MKRVSAFSASGFAREIRLSRSRSGSKRGRGGSCGSLERDGASEGGGDEGGREMREVTRQSLLSLSGHSQRLQAVRANGHQSERPLQPKAVTANGRKRERTAGERRRPEFWQRRELRHLWRAALDSPRETLSRLRRGHVEIASASREGIGRGDPVEIERGWEIARGDRARRSCEEDRARWRVSEGREIESRASVLEAAR